MKKTILVTGCKGLLGSATMKLLNDDYVNKFKIVGVDREDYNLLKTSQVVKMYKEISPDYILHFGNVVGGIKFNIENKFDILYQNTNINNNVIGLAHENNVEKLVFIGSTCMLTPSNKRLNEDSLLSGGIPESNDSYAISKIHGYYLCKSLNSQYNRKYITVVPTNCYGELDTFDPERSHAINSIIYKIMKAKKTGGNVVLFGTGNPMRDWMHSSEAANQIMWAFENYNNPNKILCLSERNYIRNNELARLMCGFLNFDFNLVKFDGDIYKDGDKNKLTDTTYLESLGYKIFTDTEWVLLKRVCRWYEKNYKWDGSCFVTTFKR